MGERRDEMHGVVEAAKRMLSADSGEGFADILERETTGLKEETLSEKAERCSRCGGLAHERDHRSNSDRVCRCGGRISRLRYRLDAVDRDARMTLSGFDSSEPSAEATLRDAEKIVSGERRRGMLLMGLPGRGKTHLMVAIGRGLLERGRAAGYYSVVRLVSQIQDSYSDYGGESRRAIIESVASSEVVLLDDLGKEHVSANVDSIIYELFDALENSGATVVVSTNVPTTRDGSYRGPVLSERYDEAVRSRISAMCERFVLRGVDHRRLTGNS